MDDNAQAWAHQQELEQQEYEESAIGRMEAHARDFREWLEWLHKRGICCE